MFRYMTMDSAYCSMGRWISVIVGAYTNMKLYEGKDLLKLVDAPWLSEEKLREFDERLPTMTLEEVKVDEEMKQIHKVMKEAVKKAIALGPCIIHERAAGDILKEQSDCLKVLLYNTNLEHRIPRAIGDKTYDLKHLSKEEIISFIQREDEKRKKYRNAVASTHWGEITSYDLCLDSDLLSREKCAEILIETLKDVTLDLEECAAIIKQSFACTI